MKPFSSLSDYDRSDNDQAQLDSDRRFDRDQSREPRVHLRRVVTNCDRAEMLALNFSSAFTAVRK